MRTIAAMFLVVGLGTTAAYAQQTPPAPEAKQLTAGQLAARDRQAKCGAEYKTIPEPKEKWPQFWAKCNQRLQGKAVELDSSIEADREREHQCSGEWRDAKARNLPAGKESWPAFLAKCNQRLQASGGAPAPAKKAATQAKTLTPVSRTTPPAKKEVSPALKHLHDLEATFSLWMKRCPAFLYRFSDEQPDKSLCITRILPKTSEGQFALLQATDGTAREITVSLPEERVAAFDIKEGEVRAVSGTELSQISFSKKCDAATPPKCLYIAHPYEDFVATLRAGDIFNLKGTRSGGESEIVVSIPLTGFTAAHDGAPVDDAVWASQRTTSPAKQTVARAQDFHEEFFSGKPFIQTTLGENNRDRVVLSPDGEMSKQQLAPPGRTGTGTWRRSGDEFCSTFFGSKEYCFELHRTDEGWSISWPKETDVLQTWVRDVGPGGTQTASKAPGLIPQMVIECDNTASIMRNGYNDGWGSPYQGTVVFHKEDAVDKMMFLDQARLTQWLQGFREPVRKKCGSKALSADFFGRTRDSFTVVVIDTKDDKGYHVSFLARTYQDNGWEFASNAIAAKIEADAERKRYEEQQRRAEEERQLRIRQAELERERIKNAKIAIRTEFVTKFGVQSLINEQMLSTNPFVYKNQVVGVPTVFGRMIAEKEALFYRDGVGVTALLVSGVPSTQFTSQVPVVLAMKVLGTRAIKTAGGEATLPFGEYVGIFSCNERSCAEFYDEAH